MRTRIFLIALILTASGCAGNPAQLEENKRIVLDFYDKGLNQKDFAVRAAFDVLPE